MMDKIFPKVHEEGYKFLTIFVILTIILYFVNGFLGFIGLTPRGLNPPDIPANLEP